MAKEPHRRITSPELVNDRALDIAAARSGEHW
jgi:hypothetical protein